MDPICFHLGPKPVYWYGVMMALAFLAGMTHWRWVGRRTSRDVSLAGDLAFWLMVGGILGARIAYVASDWSYFQARPWEIIRIDQGGLIYYGGFIGGLVAFLGVAKHYRLPALDLADFVVTALPLGHAFGRIGCFLNGCCGGRSCEPSWITGGLAHFPVQLYESAFNLGLYAFLTWFFLKRRGRRLGSVMALYLLTYPVERFLIEFLRGDDRMRLGTLDIAQVVSLTLFLTGIVLWHIANRNPADKGESEKKTV